MAVIARVDPEKRADMMLNEPTSTAILKAAGPTIVAFLITAVYNLADTYFVSSLGTNATAAVSVNASLDQIIALSGTMLATGAGSYVSRLLGAENKGKAERVLATAFFLALGFGTLVMVFGGLFIWPMVRMLGATETCERFAVDYATYVLLVAPFMASTYVMNQCLRAEGSAMFSMIGMGVGGILNCILDPFFIITLDLGVAGASMATAISKLISFAILISPYLRGRSLLRISIRNFHPSVDIFVQVISVGSSSMIRSVLAIVSAIVLNHIAGGISDSVMAGVGVCTKVMVFPFNIILGLSTGLQPVAGFNWGARRYERVWGCFRFAAWVAVFSSGIMALLLGIFAPQVISLFTVADQEMMAVGVLCIRFQCIALPIHAWVCMVNQFCGSLGKAWGMIILATARQGTCFIPIAYPLAYFFGASGIAAVQAIADCLSMFLAIPIIIAVRREIRNALHQQKMAGEQLVKSVC